MILLCEECGGSYKDGGQCLFCRVAERMETDTADFLLQKWTKEAIVDVIVYAEELLKERYELRMGSGASVSPFSGVYAVIMPEPAKRFMDTYLGVDSFGDYAQIVWAEGTQAFVLSSGMFERVPLPAFVTTFETF